MDEVLFRLYMETEIGTGYMTFHFWAEEEKIGYKRNVRHSTCGGLLLPSFTWHLRGYRTMIPAKYHSLDVHWYIHIPEEV
jgi:hypothetical protein